MLKDTSGEKVCLVPRENFTRLPPPEELNSISQSIQLWIATNMCSANLAKVNDEGLPDYRNPKNFIVVSAPYPTVTAQAADLVLPTAMWIEKEGAWGRSTNNPPPDHFSNRVLHFSQTARIFCSALWLPSGSHNRIGQDWSYYN
jgi:Molybdopterin oxidoreductase